MIAHIGGIPLEESVLQLAPAGAATLTAVAIACRTRLSRPSARLVLAAFLLAITAVALVWIGRAGADAARPAAPAAVSTSFSNIPTGKADATTATGLACTCSPNFVDMPGMSETFKLGGQSNQPVIVLFQGVWFTSTPGAEADIRLTIDGVPQPGLAEMIERNLDEGAREEARGFNFVSQPLAPGTHTAKIQFRDNGQGPIHVGDRNLIVLHK